jgi:hypothetical protein
VVYSRRGPRTARSSREPTAAEPSSARSTGVGATYQLMLSFLTSTWGVRPTGRHAALGLTRRPRGRDCRVRARRVLPPDLRRARTTPKGAIHFIGTNGPSQNGLGSPVCEKKVPPTLAPGQRPKMGDRIPARQLSSWTGPLTRRPESPPESISGYESPGRVRLAGWITAARRAGHAGRTARPARFLPWAFGRYTVDGCPPRSRSCPPRVRSDRGELGDHVCHRDGR